MIRWLLQRCLLLFSRLYISLRANPNPGLVEIYNNIVKQETEYKEMTKLSKITKEYLKKGYVSNKKLYLMRTLAKKYQARTDVEYVKLEGVFNG